MEEVEKRYVLEKDPDLGFGFSLEQRENHYFVQTLTPDGPASKAGLTEFARVCNLNDTDITGILPEQVAYSSSSLSLT